MYALDRSGQQAHTLDGAEFGGLPVLTIDPASDQVAFGRKVSHNLRAEAGCCCRLERSQLTAPVNPQAGGVFPADAQHKAFPIHRDAVVAVGQAGDAFAANFFGCMSGRDPGDDLVQPVGLPGQRPDRLPVEAGKVFVLVAPFAQAGETQPVQQPVRCRVVRVGLGHHPFGAQTVKSQPQERPADFGGIAPAL